MNHFFLDASALGKRYVVEIGTPLVNRLFDTVPRTRMSALLLGVGEIVSILVLELSSAGRNDQEPKEKGRWSSGKVLEGSPPCS